MKYLKRTEIKEKDFIHVGDRERAYFMAESKGGKLFLHPNGFSECTYDVPLDLVSKKMRIIDVGKEKDSAEL